MGKITTSYQDSNTTWGAAAWDNGIPNGIDDLAHLYGNLTAIRSLSIPAATTFTIGGIQTSDPTATYFDWNITGTSATTSILNFQTSDSTIPSILSADGGTYSALLAGNQGLQITGGNLTTDRITISNVNNTITGPLYLEYGQLTTITGKLTAATRISSNNSFTGVTYSGILGLSGSVDLQTSGLNIRDIDFLGEVSATSELTSSNGSSVTSAPAAHTTNLKISAPMVLTGVSVSSDVSAYNKTIEYSGVISGVSPSLNTSQIYTLGLNRTVASGYAIFRLSNPLNTFTGGPPVVLTRDTGDLVDGQAILEYSTIANSGVASSVGAGTTFFMPAWRTCTYRCIGAGGTSNRQLAPAGGTMGGNYSLENNGIGPVIFNSTISSSFSHWPVLGGTNTGLNEISQPLTFTKPLVKDNTGRWCLDGSKRYSAVTTYNAGPRTWLTNLGVLSATDGSAQNYFVFVVGGYLRFKSGLDLRHNAANTSLQSRIRQYPFSSIELDNYSIPPSYQVGTTTTFYPTHIFLQNSGPNDDGGLRSVAGSNTFTPSFLTIYDNLRINAEAGASLTLNVGSGAGTAINGTGYILTFGGGGTITNQNPISAGSVIKDGAGSLIYNVVNGYSGGTTIHGGRILANVGGANGAFRGLLTLNSGSYFEANADSSFGYTSGSNVTTVTVNSGSFIQANAKVFQNAGGAGHYHIYNNASVRGSGDYYHENASHVRTSGQSYSDPGIRYSFVNASTDIDVQSGKFDIRGPLSPDIGGRTPTAGIRKLGVGKLQLSSSTSTISGTINVERGTLIAAVSAATANSTMLLSGSFQAPVGVRANFKSGIITATSSSFIYGNELNETLLTSLTTLTLTSSTTYAFSDVNPGDTYALYDFQTLNGSIVNFTASYSDPGVVLKSYLLGKKLIVKTFGAKIQVTTNLSIPTPSTIILGKTYKEPGTYKLIQYTNFNTAELSNLRIIPPTNSGRNVTSPFLSGGFVCVIVY